MNRESPPRASAIYYWDYPGRKSPSPHWQVYGDQTWIIYTGYDENVKVVKPYAIEEPDDVPEDQSSESPGSTPQWQRELVDFMGDLQCESDSSGSSFRSDQKRGQKRKSTSTASPDYEPDRSSPSKLTLRPDESEYECPSASPKRRCRKDKRKQKTNSETAQAAFLSLSFRDTRSSVSSDSEAPFSGVNSAGPTFDEANAPDEMDTD